MSENLTGNEAVQKSNKKMAGIFIAIIVLLVAVIASLIFAFVYAQKDEGAKPGMGSVRGVVTNEEEARKLMEEMSKEKVENGYFQTSMTNDWIFPNGTAASTNAYVGNASENTRPFCFDLILDDETQETIYSSPVIPIGTHLDNIVLDKALPAGQYRCVMLHRFLDKNYLETGSTLRLAINITVSQ